ncbi:hypothetical protein AJGP001_03030 [Planococcus faecalis]|uniref:N-acetyltransferase domain-containing protein n=1 Tax=Planococcus faecalis TaxID=1598147 RepID=A0ABN4XQA4_9BACL|nr:hypothetical protein AJGP001_03030 [Planococcus faecalis]OHX51321.1 hypothetical protein BB777_17200 [Planococcus faecalis]
MEQLTNRKKEVIVTYAIRSAQPEDGTKIIEFYNRVGGETDYLSFGHDEYSLSAESLTQVIVQMKKFKGTCMFLVIEGEEILGIGTIDSSSKPRYRHVGTLGIVISQSHTGNGLGRVLMNTLIDWAKTNGQTEKISLVTRADNERAIALYKKVGFEQEGTFYRDVYDGERYYDNLSMALYL